MAPSGLQARLCHAFLVIRAVLMSTMLSFHLTDVLFSFTSIQQFSRQIWNRFSIFREFTTSEILHRRIYGNVAICKIHTYIQGMPIKNNPFGKIHYLSYCNRFFHQICGLHRRGFMPRKQQISLQYLLLVKNYNHLNLKLHFSK